jgi:hypothetical protein
VKETVMTMRASGKFEVVLKPQPLVHSDETQMLGRMSIEKTFHGDLEATSRGEMLSARTAVQASAGYVAIERVVGTLGGRSGSFVLFHKGAMDRGVAHLDCTVVPDSGTGELERLSGSLAIEIKDGQHFYSFEYAIGAATSAS